MLGSAADCCAGPLEDKPPNAMEQVCTSTETATNVRRSGLTRLPSVWALIVSVSGSAHQFAGLSAAASSSKLAQRGTGTRCTSVLCPQPCTLLLGIREHEYVSQLFVANPLAQLHQLRAWSATAIHRVAVPGRDIKCDSFARQTSAAAIICDCPAQRSCAVIAVSTLRLDELEDFVAADRILVCC